MKHLIPIIVLSSFLLLTGCGSSDCISCLWAGETPAPVVPTVTPTAQPEPTTQPEQPTKAAIIRGVVRRGGTPIKNARVTLNTKAAIETLTDAEGKFEFAVGTAGFYTVTVLKPPYKFSQKKVNVTDFKQISETLDEAALEFELTRNRILYGGSGSDSLFLFSTRTKRAKRYFKHLSDGSIFIFGLSGSKDGDLDESDGEAWGLHLDKDGEIISSRKYDVSLYEGIFYNILSYDRTLCEEGKDHSLLYLSTTKDNKFAILFHIASDGTPISREELGGLNHNTFSYITKVADGTFWATGASRSIDIDKNTAKPTTVPEDQLKNHGGADGWLVHLDQNGNVISNMLIGGSAYEQLYWIKSAPDGTMWAVGTSGSTDGDITTGNLGQNGYLWVVHLDSSGNILSSYRHGNKVQDLPFCSLAIAPDSSLWYAGAGTKEDGEFQNAGGYAGNDGWLLHIASDGQVLSSQRYGGSGEDYFYNMALAPDGTIWLLGKSKSTDGELQDVPACGYENQNSSAEGNWVIHIDPTKPRSEKEHILSSRRYGGLRVNLIYDLTIASDSSIWVTGGTNSQDGDFENIPDKPAGTNGWLMHLGRNGEILTNKLYGGSKDEFFSGMSEIRDDMVWVFGSAYGYDGITTDGDFEGDTYHGGKNDGWAMQVDLKDLTDLEK